MKSASEWLQFYLEHYGPKTLDDLAEARWLNTQWHKQSGEKRLSVKRVAGYIRSTVVAQVQRGLVKWVKLDGLHHVALSTWSPAEPARINQCSDWRSPPRSVSANCSCHGGHLKDAQQPVQWFKERADYQPFVKVRVMKFYGIGVHWHVSITEEDDAVLGKDGEWFIPWLKTDTAEQAEIWRAHNGHRDDDKFCTIKAAESWIQRKLDERFPGKDVWVRFEGDKLGNRWHYGEGD